MKIPTLTTLLLTIFATAVHAAGEIMIQDAWVREAPPAAQVMAAYMTLHNHAAQARRIIKVSSPQFGTVEMHDTEISDDEARMVRKDFLPLPAQGSVQLKPGGLHLMLINPIASYRAGATVELSIELDDKQVITTALPVRKDDGSNSGDHHDHKHMHDSPAPAMQHNHHQHNH